MTYGLQCLFVDSATNETIDTFLDFLAEPGRMGVIGAHSSTVGIASKIDYILTGAATRGIDVVTMHEALKSYRNLFEVGDFITNEGATVNQPRYFIVSSTGEVFQGQTRFTREGFRLIANDLASYIQQYDGIKNFHIEVTGTGTLSIRNGNNVAGDTSRTEVMKVLPGERDLEFVNSGKGIVLKTPDGTKRYRISVNNSGAIVTTLL